jgi:hypothetical protein
MNPSNQLAEVGDRLRQELPRLRARYQVESLALFGSRVRGEESVDSDLDVLVAFLEVPGLLKFIELENHLSDLLGVRVDLVMKDALKPRVSERVLREAVAV